MKRRKTVLVVDDSALMRQMLTSLINRAPDLEVVGAAPDPLIARKMIKELNPDVVTLDIEMPKMDGITFLSKIMTLRPTPVVMISSLTQESAEATMKALELGAVDYVAKPMSGLRENLLLLEDEITAKVRSAAGARVRQLVLKGDAKPNLSFSTTEQVIAIGASTGGVQAITQILEEMPANSPAVVITQHMPKEFTGGFAARLNGKTAMQVSEARQGERIIPGHVFIAPGDTHLGVQRSGAYYTCNLTDGPKVSGHRPSVDAMFASVAEAVGDRAIGVILTGMGKDGAEGLLQMRKAGARTFGQDEATATVYGMCGVAWKTGAVEQQLPLSQMASNILNACRDIGEACRKAG
ncbi:protein-glutamate methylesterase/protein-glutamine glutaminase [Emcibacter nanhaiensis]|uniref:Protein-glutamate methylesterase/protein-glutamine glutaminase n=1 Tax=Emcibacter nanhaiensis TaxID=1505037 RepID=A0A501PC39_9PROT|nr:chemotaxis response regulator protein-glutamate methylesterase [Emcibacter nanhaiensis]